MLVWSDTYLTRVVTDPLALPEVDQPDGPVVEHENVTRMGVGVEETVS